LRIQSPTAKHHIFKGMIGVSPDFPMDEAPRIVKRRCYEWNLWKIALPGKVVYQLEGGKERNLVSFPDTLVVLARLFSLLFIITAVYTSPLFLNLPWVLATNTLLLGWIFPYAQLGSLGLSFIQPRFIESGRHLIASEARLDAIIDRIEQRDERLLKENFGEILQMVNAVYCR
jgi:hypothetical protein